jgi:hypothetical protein
MEKSSQPFHVRPGQRKAEPVVTTTIPPEQLAPVTTVMQSGFFTPPTHAPIRCCALQFWQQSSALS